MSAERPDNTKRIFNAAAGIQDAVEQAAYLDQACGENQSLRAEIEDLLSRDQDAGPFLDVPAAYIAATIDVPPIAERLGTQIGPYKLHQEIGEGGMGVVYMALQKEPVRRKVALKIIKPGMDTREVIARFAAEEQALAMMDHPNIAKVHDAGTTDSGRPYFVMELVHGVTITQYCDDNNLTTDQRLELFVSVCHAVQHAHQKGIIHRDIKPSNILVTLHDGVPVPKIIDFGIAKATNQQLTTQTLATGYGQMIGTPLYMSPEQAQYSGLDIDTRSDIYSLGVLLYELLTGSTPFDREQFQDAGLDEVRRLIREQEPQRPSTRISTMGMAATTVSEHRRTNPVELSNSLRHELDWIVMKALEKDRARRYETANDFARDIQRYLDDEPVEACPPSKIYRLKKFTRRNRTAVLATTAVGFALVLGAGVAAGQAYRATKAETLAEEQLQIATEQQRLAKQQAQLAQKQKRLAEEAAEREGKLRVDAEQATQQAEAARKQAEAVTEYLVEAFRSPDPEKDGRTVTVAEILDRAAGDLETNLSAEPELHAQLLLAIGQTYRGLGLYEEAVRLLERCRDLVDQTLSAEHPDSLKLLRALSGAYWQMGRHDEALELSAKSHEMHVKVLGANHPETLLDATTSQCAFVMSGHTEEAIRLGEELLPRALEVLGPEHPTTRDTAHNLAQAYVLARQYDNAIKILEAALPHLRKAHGAKDSGTLVFLASLGNAYGQVGRDEESLALLEETLQLQREVFGPDHPVTLNCMSSLASSLRNSGRVLEAISVLEEALQIKKRVLGSAHESTLVGMSNLAICHQLAGHFEPGTRLLQEARQLCSDHRGQRDFHTLDISSALASVLLDTGQYDAASKLAEETAPLMSETRGLRSPQTLGVKKTLARAYSHLGRHAEAIQLAEEVLRDSTETLGAEHRDTLKSTASAAAIYTAAGRYQEGVALLEKVLPVLREKYGRESITTLTTMSDLAVAYQGAGRLEEATALHAETLQLRQKALGPEHPQTLASMILLGSAYVEQGKHAEAEPLLLAAQEGYAKRDAAYPTPYDHSQAREACTHLVQLYEKTNQPDKATAWKEKLAALTEESK